MTGSALGEISREEKAQAGNSTSVEIPEGLDPDTANYSGPVSQDRISLGLS